MLTGEVSNNYSSTGEDNSWIVTLLPLCKWLYACTCRVTELGDTLLLHYRLFLPMQRLPVCSGRLPPGARDWPKWWLNPSTNISHTQRVWYSGLPGGLLSTWHSLTGVSILVLSIGCISMDVGVSTYQCKCDIDKYMKVESLQVYTANYLLLA